MRWGVRTRRAKGEILCAVTVTAGVRRLRWGSRRSTSRMAKADAVGGSHKASHRRDLVRRSGNRRRVSVAVGESQRSSRKRRLMRWGVRTRRAKGEILCAVAETACVRRLRWGSRRSRAEWRRLMRWGADAGPPLLAGNPPAPALPLSVPLRNRHNPIDHSADGLGAHRGFHRSGTGICVHSISRLCRRAGCHQ